MTQINRSYISLPAIVKKTKLPGGRIHKVQIDSQDVAIATWKDIYGNQTSETVLKIPMSAISNVEYKYSSRGSGQLKLTFSDEVGASKSLALFAVDSQAHRNQNQLTKLMVNAVESFQNGENNMPPLEIALTPPSLKGKFIFGFSLFTMQFLIAIFSRNIESLFVFGAFVVFPSLVALVIDYMRNHTNWSLIKKIVVSVIAFCAMFGLLVSTIVLFDYLR